MYIFKLEQEQFEGPLDLLLSLIEKRKLDITRLSLAKIAEEYVTYLSQEGEVPLESMAGFLGVAAQLLLIKSKALLPFLVLKEEEEESIDDLESRLKEYKKFKDAALQLGVLFGKRRFSFGHNPIAIEVEKNFYPPSNVNVAELEKRFTSILGDIPILDPLEEETIEDVMTLEEKIVVLRETFEQRVNTSFHEVVSDPEDRMEVIVSFLAMLELVKQRVIHADQQDLFVEISLTKKQDEIVV